MPGVKPGVITGDAAWALLNFAKENGFAIPAFNCVTTSSCNSVLEAAAKLDRPIMIQFSQGGAHFFAGKSLPNGKQEASILGAVAGAHYVRNVAVAYGVTVFVHSDHCAKKLLPWFDGCVALWESAACVARICHLPSFSRALFDAPLRHVLIVRPLACGELGCCTAFSGGHFE